MFPFNGRKSLVRRYRRIADVLLKHGLGFLLERLHLTNLVSLSIRLAHGFSGELPRERNLALRVKSAIEELGPTFIKFGQLLSVRPDILPEEYGLELRELLDSVQPDDFTHVRATIERELGGPIDRFFTEVGETPIGSASICQAHRARLKDGSWVTLKVLHKGIETTVRDDLEVLYGLARLVETRMPELAIYEPVRLVEEFEKHILKEMDLSNEGQNADAFRRNFEGDARVLMPRVHWETTRRGLLTIEYVDGIKISDVAALRAAGHDPVLIARRGAELFAKMVLVDGLFHGDPHAGNLFIAGDNRICFIDFGITGHLSLDQREKLTLLIAGVTLRDTALIVKGMFLMDMLPGDWDASAFKSDTEEFLNEYYNLPLKQIEIGKLIYEIIKIANRHRIRVPACFSLLSKTLLTMEGLGRTLDPEFELFPILKPHLMRFAWNLFTPERLVRDGIHFLDDLRTFFFVLPFRINTITKKLERGDLSLEFRHVGLEELITKLDTVSTRISAAMVISAIIIGSSLITFSGKGPTVMGVPAFGAVGFIIAGILGLILVASILRSGKL